VMWLGNSLYIFKRKSVAFCMKIAIISDVHDNAHNLVQALEAIYERDVEKIIFLGDFAGAAIANLLVSSKVPVFAIWGNI
jgi:uncharacterized protein